MATHSYTATFHTHLNILFWPNSKQKNVTGKIVTNTKYDKNPRITGLWTINQVFTMYEASRGVRTKGFSYYPTKMFNISPFHCKSRVACLSMVNGCDSFNLYNTIVFISAFHSIIKGNMFNHLCKHYLCIFYIIQWILLRIMHDRRIGKHKVICADIFKLVRSMLSF